MRSATFKASLEGFYSIEVRYFRIYDTEKKKTMIHGVLVLHLKYKATVKSPITVNSNTCNMRTLLIVLSSLRKQLLSIHIEISLISKYICPIDVLR